MSHRVTQKTDITNKELATTALKNVGWSFVEQSNSVLRITSGPMSHSTIDLRTGTVTGDSDWHSRDTLGALRQHYSEALVQQENLKKGAMVESREVLANGDIRIVASAHLG